MTLAPSHRQRLSGSKLLLLAALIITGLSACDLLKPLPKEDNGEDDQTELDPIQGRRVYDPETGTYIVVETAPTEPMDTIVWKDIPSSEAPPIYSTAGAVVADPTGSNPISPIGVGAEGSQLLSAYNVAVLLPFLTDRYDTQGDDLPENSEWALQFYGGMQMAFDDLASEGIALNVSVLDTRASEVTVGNLVRSNTDVTNAHLVIGPYRRNNVAAVAERMRLSGGVVVSPHTAANNVTQDNPNYVQVNPTLESHCEAIMQHAFAHYRPDQIVLVARDDEAEKARLDYFQREYRRLTGLMDSAELQELIVTATQSDLSDLNLKPYLQYADEKVFIMPMWSDEIFIYNFMRKLDLDRAADQRITIYGMPQWMGFERIDFNYYEKLNVHVSSSVFMNPFNPDIQQFRRRYFERYGTVPNEEAFVGYDVTRYFCRMINKYGTRFQYQLETADAERDMLHTTFAFEGVVNAGTTGMENRGIQRWENKYLNILQFKDYQFQLAE
ncbi:MAG: amino acid ABC transporter substrate-binding protein [Lewinella sp.]|nr:amino acid ABC transporter substrate-binding protein [Lewinella sp.]